MFAKKELHRRAEDASLPPSACDGRQMHIGIQPIVGFDDVEWADLVLFGLGGGQQLGATPVFDRQIVRDVSALAALRLSTYQCQEQAVDVFGLSRDSVCVVGLPIVGIGDLAIVGFKIRQFELRPVEVIAVAPSFVQTVGN